MAIQKIYYGAPGTGKSNSVKNILQNIDKSYIFRTTIHPEYSYSDFVGQLLPVENEGNLKFEFNAGVFTLALKKAYEDTNKQVFLVLEEISRGNIAAIFGDIFQLLDRDPVTGESEYPIFNKHISKEVKVIAGNSVSLPHNFNIICTVNTNDQNVFPMDTAFKRRFDWEYVSTKPVMNDFGDIDTDLNNFRIIINNESGTFNTNWINFYVTLNDFIVNKEYGLDKNEDKQLGQFFIKINEGLVTQSYSNNDDERKQADLEINTILKNKLLHYLWQDVQGNINFGKKTNSLFSENIVSFDKLYDNFGVKQVFSKVFLEKLELSRDKNKHSGE